ncbi:hypothetical protein AFLA_012344 [Aspergillus flavus NRRL3357]|nr:hypothetical protein AFLA_012344 [Aspergillus flavus NRRL3357]KAJ1707254.1 MFS general substrate transporter [Aspergillus flavus]
MSSLIGFRFLAGSAGSAPLALGAGTIADIMEPQNRGLAIAVWATGPVVGSVVGTVCGGFLTENASWRWAFWVIATLVPSFLSTIEGKRRNRLRSRVGKRLIRETGHSNKRSTLHTDITPSGLFTTSIMRPLQMLVFSPIISALSLYVAVVYGFLYLLFTTMSQVYGNQYNFTAKFVGLTYIGLGAGSTIGLLAMGRFSDVVSKRLAGGTKGPWEPEFRLALMIPLSLGLPIGLFWYGWAAEKKEHWIMPIIGTGWIGIGVVASFVAIQGYLVDAFTTPAVSAAAASTVLQSLLGAVLPLSGPSMYSALGLGWGNTVLAFIAIAMLPLPLVFFTYGARVREKHLFVL